MKATALATIIFWIVLLSEGFSSPIFSIILLSIIPISMVCSLTIIITISPFCWLAKEGVTASEIFKKYFPYYAISLFGISTYFIMSTHFENFVYALFISAFFTLLQSWIWICKTPVSHKNNMKIKNKLHDKIQ